jgi:tetratricopeptide (TPR) repeat protein
MDKRRSARGKLELSQQLLAQGNFGGALQANQEALSILGKATPRDKALFNIGLIYAHYENPDKDYAQSKIFFDTLIRECPQSILVEQAKMWKNTLDCVEREKQDSTKLEKKIEDLERKTKKKELASWKQNGKSYFEDSQKLLKGGKYEDVLKNADSVLEKNDKSIKDKALFNKGLVFAHPGYVEKDYKKASDYFKIITEEYPESYLFEQAEMWVRMLDAIQVDIELEQKKKELEEEVDTAIETKKKELEIQASQPVVGEPSNSEPVKKDIDQLVSAANAGKVKQDKKIILKKRKSRKAVLKDAGGNLSSLAEKYYGSGDATFCDRILKDNPDITDVRKIGDNQEITIFEIIPDSYIEESHGGSFKIHIATFYTSESANAFKKKVQGVMKTPFLAVDNYKVSSKDTWYRVTMKGFKNKEEALQKVNRLIDEELISIPPEFK